MSKFKIGDKVIIIAHSIEYIPGMYSYIGEITEIVSELESLYNNLSGRLAKVYRLDLVSPNGNQVSMEPHCLKHIYDGDEKSSWEDMKDLWQPKELEKCPSESVTAE